MMGAILSLPLFDGGRREALVESARADLDAEAEAFRERILVAFREVEDHLSALRILADQERAQAQAAAAAQRARQLADSRYGNGLGSRLDSLDAQRAELRQRRQALQYQATVGLIRALVGGWENPPAPVHGGEATAGARYVAGR